MALDFNEEIVLENNRVRLVPLGQEHTALLAGVASEDPHLMKYSPSAVHTPELLEKYIASARRERAATTKYPFAIFDKQVGEWAGSTSYGNVANADLRLEIGWTWIGRRFQRTGLNRACKFLLLRQAFEGLGFERVEFKTDARNVQSRTAILAIGATFEGEFRSHSVMSDGFRRNTVYYSILKAEWPEIKSTVFAAFAD